MFNLSTQEVVLSIEKSPLLVKEGIYYQHYQNFFGNDILKNLESVENLRTEEFSYSGQHVIPGRQLIDYSETAIKKMKILFSNEKITKSLENKFDTKLKFGSVDVWTDKPGYFMAPHTDDPSIKLAVQIYLGEGQNVGTCLFDNNENISLDDAKKIIDGTFEKKSNVIKEFERGVKVMNGKYGPYLNFNKKNYKIPKNINPQEITYKECQSIINK